MTGHCQVGSAKGPACELTRNAVVLSVVKELTNLQKKSKRLCLKDIFLVLLGRFKAEVQILDTKYSDCCGGSDLRYVYPFYPFTSLSSNISIDLYPTLIIVTVYPPVQ